MNTLHGEKNVWLINALENVYHIIMDLVSALASYFKELLHEYYRIRVVKVEKQ